MCGVSKRELHYILNCIEGELNFSYIIKYIIGFYIVNVKRCSICIIRKIVFWYILLVKYFCMGSLNK